MDRGYYALGPNLLLWLTSYDAKGRPVDLAGASGGNHTYYGYDAIGRLGSLYTGLVQDGYTALTTFGYNPAGQIASRTNDNDAHAWPGAANADVASANYTANGAVTSVTGAQGQPDRLRP